MVLFTISSCNFLKTVDSTHVTDLHLRYDLTAG